ncbi:MAG TPA: hypothetical protein VGG04_09885 [Candidatus Sulfotelmatobacter sp.]
MKKFLFGAVMAVIAAAAVSPAHAQVEKRMSVNVPFEFVLNKSTLRSGQYKVEDLSTGVVVFTNADGYLRRFAVTTPGGLVTNKHHGEPFLVFTRYGNVAFLSKVVFSESDNFNLPKTNRERELIANLGSGQEVAMVIQPAQ